jgi:excisionase family DNA binding protein
LASIAPYASDRIGRINGEGGKPLAGSTHVLVSSADLPRRFQRGDVADSGIGGQDAGSYFGGDGARQRRHTLIPVHEELTTQEAADMLNISRPSLIQLLDEGKIEYRKVGTHRRVRFEALMSYKRAAAAKRRAALAELAAYDQEIGI